jgi:hypothetical protein
MAYDVSKLNIPQSVKDRGLRGATQSQLDILKRSIQNLPGKYDKLRDSRKANVKLGLTGLGNYQVGDNPDTTEVETDAVFRADKQIGDRETQAVREADSSANARGMMFSSFRDKSVGAALGRLSREAQQVITQYATDMGKLNDDQIGEENDLYGQMNTLYGSEADYLRDNPPTPPEPPANSGGGDTGGGDTGGGSTDTKTLSANQKLAKEQGWLGPWTGSDAPKLDRTKFSVFKRNGVWFAQRKA